jgi:hypothetical protein
MNLEKILSISGKPGLYALKVQTRTGFVAESLLDGKKVTVSLKSNVSLLSEISIYTYEGEKPLSEIIKAIASKEKNGPAISHKEENAKLAAYFKEILPDYDEERVYPSDIKKILNWYNMLQERGMIVTEEVVSEEVVSEEVVSEEVVSEEVLAEAPVKKAAVKKAKTVKE